MNPRLIQIPAGNGFTFASGRRVEEGESLTFDLSKTPMAGELVVLKRADRAPFVRECYIGVSDGIPRHEWAMGVLDRDGLVVTIDLADFEWVGGEIRLPKTCQKADGRQRRSRRQGKRQLQAA